MFNNSNEQAVYEKGNEYHLKFPKSTIKIYKYSGYGVMYYSKLTYDEFIEYYRNDGYVVENN